MTMQPLAAPKLGFFNPKEPHKASSPALLLGYEMILGVLGQGKVDEALFERIDGIEKELEERGLLGTFRRMLEQDRREKRSLKMEAVQEQPAGVTPQDAPSEQVLFLYRHLTHKIQEAKNAGDEKLRYRLEVHREVAEREMHRRELWPVLEQLCEVDARRAEARGHAAN